MWTDFLGSRYVRSLEQQIVELKAEKAEQKAEIARLNQCLVPALRAMERERQHVAPGAHVPITRVQLKSKVDENGDRAVQVERKPAIRSWIQARDTMERLSDSDEARVQLARNQ